MARVRIIRKRYRIDSPLGSGGMGTVFKGTDTRTGKTVAIKLLKPEAIAKVPDIIERFAREGQALRQLNHPNIVKVLAMFSGHYSEAENYYRESYVVWREMGTLDRVAFNAANLFQLAFVRGDMGQARALVDEAQGIWADIRGPSARERIRSIAIPLEILAENYAEARRLCEVQRPFAGSRTDTLMGLEWRFALANCGLRNYPAAYRSMQLTLDYATILEATAFKLFSLPVAGILMAHEGKSGRAAELLALAFSHPRSATGWMEKWPLLTRLRNDLQTKLGKETYDAALEQGKSLDLGTVVQELLAESE
jgi:hypothetical protein